MYSLEPEPAQLHTPLSKAIGAAFDYYHWWDSDPNADQVAYQACGDSTSFTGAERAVRRILPDADASTVGRIAIGARMASIRGYGDDAYRHQRAFNDALLGLTVGGTGVESRRCVMQELTAYKIGYGLDELVELAAMIVDDPGISESAELQS